MFFYAFMCDIIKMDKLKKKKRSENLTKEDKEILQRLIREKVNVIENKNTDTNTNQRKNKAWKDVEESFNQVASSRRNVNQLKCQWTIIKVNARKSDSVHKQAVSKTGGGPPLQESAVSCNDLRAWLPNEFVLDHNEFDSDQLLTKPTQHKTFPKRFIKVTIKTF